MELYAACESDVRKWTKELDQWNERDFNSMKLYLYYTDGQMYVYGRTYRSGCVDVR